MRFNLSITALLLCALAAGAPSAANAQKIKEKGEKTRAEAAQQDKAGAAAGWQADEATVMATPTVNVTLSTDSGKIMVRGWDKNEVRVHAPGTKISFRKGGAEPASRLEVLLYEQSDEEEEGEPVESEVDVDVSIEVPRGATVYLRTQDGDIEVEDVAEARVGTVGGRIDLRHISRATEAASVGGDVMLEDSSGRARLSSFGSVIGVRGLKQLDPGDFLEAKTASGDIVLDNVGPARVKANTISGVLKLVGPLARGGLYDFNTTTGDVTLVLPSDSSFNLNAKVSEGGEIVTEFPLKYRGMASPPSTNPQRTGRIQGTYGTGDATINLVSFSGTVRLRKK